MNNLAWQPAVQPPELPPGAVHLWRFWLAGRSDRVALWGYLNADERRRAESFYKPIHAERFAAGRGVLRTLVAAYAGLAPREVVFEAGPFGKPCLASPASGKLSFNLSHSENLAVAAFARGGQLGIDVEWVRPLPDAHSIARRQFHAAEAHWLGNAPAERQAEVFFHIWTRKEAALKAVGAGLSIDLQAFDVTAVQGRGETHPLALGPKLPACPWNWHEFAAAPGYQACLVSDEAVTELQAFEYPAETHP